MIRTYNTLFLILFTLTWSGATSQENPTLSKWQEGVVVNEFIYDQASFPSCHSATLVETNDGHLIYAFFGGTKERNPDVEIYVCHHVDGQWSAPTSVADGVQDDGSRWPTWNPVLFQIPDGDLLLFYKVGPKPSEWWGMLKRSKDGGKTWSEAEKLPDGILGPIKNKPLLLENGTLISPSSTEGNGWNIHFELSDDLGKTWQKIGPIERGVDPMNAIQPSILVHGKGKLQILARTRNWAIVESWSTDYGKTWTPLAKTTLPNNNSGTDAVTMKNGKHVLVYNHVLPPADNPKGKRTPLNVAVSKDGVHWDAALILEDSPISQYSYPAVIQTSDGLLHFAYTWRRQKMKHVVVDPQKWRTKKIKKGLWPKKKGYVSPEEKHYVKEED